MDLAESAGAVAIWCRDGCRWKMRSIDSVWWDDSTALAVSAEQWRERLRQFSGAGREPIHAWIANAPRGSQVLDARAGGVALTLSKPFQIAPLLALLDSSHSQEGDASATLRVRESRRIGFPDAGEASSSKWFRCRRVSPTNLTRVIQRIPVTVGRSERGQQTAGSTRSLENPSTEAIIVFC